MARPALSEEERFRRRTALLDAARYLYRENWTIPTVSNIAKVAGIAKGAVYLWFRSKEEIFVALLEDSLLKLNMQVLYIINSLDPSLSSAAGNFAAKYVKLLDKVPDAVRLSSVASSIFRENLPIESLSRLNRNLGAGLSEAGDLLERRVGCLEPGQGAHLLFWTWTLTVGLWLIMDKPDDLRKIIDAPALSLFRRDFHEELQAAVTQLWRGAMNCD
jgi:AcrR family transcriptional regulator